MKSIALNVTFLSGIAMVAIAAFLIWIPFGFLTLGVSLVSVSIAVQLQNKKAVKK